MPEKMKFHPNFLPPQVFAERKKVPLQMAFILTKTTKIKNNENNAKVFSDPADKKDGEVRFALNFLGKRRQRITF
jgi:hypothetical protein